MPEAKLFDRTRALIAEVAPQISPAVRRDQEGAFLDLPAPSNADYRFSLYTGEPQIHATLLPPNENCWFWYWPFEEQDYRTLEDQEAHFLRCARLLLTCPTRITQRRRLLETQFLCEVDARSNPVPIGGAYGALLWFRVPKIQGRCHVWRSPPVLSAA